MLKNRFEEERLYSNQSQVHWIVSYRTMAAIDCHRKLFSVAGNAHLLGIINKCSTHFVFPLPVGPLTMGVNGCCNVTEVDSVGSVVGCDPISLFKL